MLTKLSVMDLEPEFPLGEDSSTLSMDVPVVLHGEIEDILYTTRHWRIHIDKIGTHQTSSKERHLHGTIPLPLVN